MAGSVDRSEAGVGNGALPGETVHVFPDTNVLLHYPPMRDINWHKLTQSRSVNLVLCMQVIHELDAKKDDRRLCDRARRVISEVDRLEEAGGGVRPGVSLEIYSRELRREDFPIDLSPDRGDDRIVRLAQAYASEHPGAEIAVCSEDKGMSLRCKSQGIRCLKPPVDIRLPSPADEQDRKYREAISELAQLKAQAPNVSVKLQGSDGKPVTLSLRRSAIAEDAEAVIRVERKELDLAPQPSPGESGFSPLARAAWTFSHTIPPSEYKRYENECEAYLRNLRRCIELRNQYSAGMGLVFEFSAVVENTGNGPATDLMICLQMPPLAAFVATEHASRGRIPELPAPPARPAKPKSWHDSVTTVLSQSSLEHIRPLPFMAAPPRALGYTFGGDVDCGFTIDLHLERLVQHRTARFGPFYAKFLSWSAASTFQVKVTMTAANIPDRVESCIPIHVRIED